MTTTNTQHAEPVPAQDAKPKAEKPSKRKPAADPEPTVAPCGAQGDAQPTTTPGPRKAPKKRVPPAQPVTLAALSDAYIEHLAASDKSSATCWSYRIELRTACRVLGANTPINSLTADDVQRYFECNAVMKLRNGRCKAAPSYQKSRRVLRLALCYAVDCGWLEKAPLPEAHESK